MAREGELSLNYRDNDQYRYYSASVQLFPWLETTLRYTDVRTRQYSSFEAFSGDQTYKDKAFDLKLRLWEESYWLPQVAVGARYIGGTGLFDAEYLVASKAWGPFYTYKDKAFDLKLRLWEESYWLPQVAVGARDIGGTGLFDAEYLVASKAWGPFDFTLGLGWGYLGTSGNVKNPLCSASDKYCYRDNSYKQAGSIDGSQMFHGPASLFGGVEYQTPWQPLRLKLEYEGNNYQQDFAGQAGSIDGSQMFHGPASLFGGVEYQTPWQPLRLKLEYEGNNYQQDFAGKLEQKSKFNVGAIYRVTDWADVNLSYERGNTFMFGVTLRTNFNDLRPSYSDNARPQYQPQPQDAILQHSVVANQLTLLKYNAGLADPQIQAKGDTLYVTGEQVKYRDPREGIIRANRIVMNDLPDGIKTIRITENRLNMPQVTTETDVASLKNHLAGEPLGHGDDGNRCRQPEKSSRRRAVGPRNEAGAKTRRASGSEVHRAGLVYRQITL